MRQFTKSRDGFEVGEVTIVSYDLLARSIDDFEKYNFGIVIFVSNSVDFTLEFSKVKYNLNNCFFKQDESHFLKSAKTARYKAAQRIADRTRHVILLSGTPVLSRPIELYSQINLIKKNFMG